jgi:ABC-2 type transport system permease protein
MIFSQLISLTVFVFLWKSIYSEGNQIGSYNLEALVTYYILSAMLGFVIQNVDVAWRVGDEIRLGNVTNFILKPVSYFWSTFWLVAGKSFFNLIVILIILLPVAFFNQNYLEKVVDLTKLTFFVISVGFSFTTHILIFYIIGLFTFWMGNARGLNFLVRMVMFFLAGNMIPLDVLPQTLININNYLPFRFIAWFPIAIWNGKINPEFSVFFPAIVWLAILGIVAFFMYKKGSQQYEGYGA